MIPRIADDSRPAPLYAAFLGELRASGFAGDLSASYADRTVLATDNSVYQVWPQAITFPRDTDDLVRVARTAQDPRFADMKLTPRGGGTGTNGQSLTDGLVVDVSRHIVGGDDGLLCIPYADTDAIYAAASAKQNAEAETMAAIRAGTSDRSWVEAALKQQGCEGL